MNVGEKGRGDGVKRRSRGVKRGQRTGQKEVRAGARDGISEEGRMSERIASCGSLYDSTNLLLQYCNNGELLLIALHQTQQKKTLVQTAQRIHLSHNLIMRRGVGLSVGYRFTGINP